MTAKVMKCVKAESHPNADSLRVYEFNHDDSTLQIVANLENVYEVGDTAIIVNVGSTLLDGTEIKLAALRGVKSYGMALGKTDVPVGTDLSNEYCQPEVISTKPSLIPWVDIESLYNIRRYLINSSLPKKIKYRGKVKIHGCCGGVQIFATDAEVDGSRIIPQSRNQILTVDHDHMGFAKWVVNNYTAFLKSRENADSLGIKEHLTIFGEICGSKVQKGVAISGVEKQIFAIFAVQIGIGDNAKFETDPEKIGRIIFGTSNGSRPEVDGEKIWETIHILPWEGGIIELNYADPDQLSNSADAINQKVDSIEKCDPWVKATFGIEGIGEGLVMYPIFNGETLVDRFDYNNYVFKAKGDKHKVVKAKKAAQIDPEVVNSINEFVDLMVTENRLNQIAQKVGEFLPKSTGQFIKELSQDVLKESTAELEASGLNWKQVAKAVGDKARLWWIKKCTELE